MLKKALLIGSLTISLMADSCWTSVEVSKFAQDEFSDYARFSIKDAVTCEALNDVLVKLGENVYKTDKNGQIKVPLPDSSVDKRVSMKMRKKGYIAADEKVMTVFGSYWNNLFLMSKDIPLKSTRVVLSWGSTPQDLDLHLISTKEHISYRHTQSISGKAKLDRDAKKGFGPETITASNLDKDETYKVVVYKYTSGGNINDKGQVRLYADSKLNKVLRLPNTKSRCIEVASIKNNSITYETKILDDSICRK